MNGVKSQKNTTNQNVTVETSPLEVDASTVGVGDIMLGTARNADEAAPDQGTIHEGIDVPALEVDTIDTTVQGLLVDLGLVRVGLDHLEEATEEEMRETIQGVLVLGSREAIARMIIRFHRRKII